MKSSLLPLLVALAVATTGLTLAQDAQASDDRVVVKRKKRPGARGSAKKERKQPVRRYSKKSKYKKPAGRVASKFKNGTPLWLIRQAFRCALDHNESSGFSCYTKWVVEARRDNPRALRHLRTYQWAHFRKWAPTYVVSNKPFSISESRRVPAKVTGETQIVKVFLISRQRDNPAPIELKREAGVWRISTNSL
jgi:hypothetical protein